MPCPYGSLPHRCLAPQYQPSHESGWRAWMVEPPRSSSSFTMAPWHGCTIFVSPWPSCCTRMEPAPCTSYWRLTSLAMMSVASSQLMRLYFEMPRVSGWRSPSGSQSSRMSGYGMRLRENACFL